jgi:hypothetical protein
MVRKHHLGKGCRLARPDPGEGHCIWIGSSLQKKSDIGLTIFTYGAMLCGHVWCFWSEGINVCVVKKAVDAEISIIYLTLRY